MDINNTFEGGMNSDASKLRQPSNTYFKALNFRPVTDAGTSIGALTNIRGNECSVNFPVVRGVYKIAIKPHDTGNYTGSFTLTINGQTTSTLVIEPNTLVSEFIDAIKALPNCYNNPSSVNPTFAVAYSDEYIVIYQSPEYTDCDANTSVEPVISVNIVSGTPEIIFIDSNDQQYYTYTPNVPAINGQPLVVIGSTFIGEVNYLFTCPEVNTYGTGQIWQLEYDELTKVSTLKLIYNNKLGFSINYPIAPSAAIGRYELDTLQRIYWTDNYNPVRSVNVKNDNLMVIPVDLINLRPSINMSIPILTDVLDGQANNPVATSTTYQCSYRLIKNNGAVTNYSTCSNIVYPLGFNTSLYNDVNQKFASIDGAVISYNKAFEFTVEGIDTDYDTIEFVIVERTYPNQDTYSVYKYDSQPINGQETIKTIFRNPSDKEEITLSEFLIENTTFSHCKTLESKDNRLFFGNVRNDLDQYLRTFDTRTYRFSNSATTGKVMKYESDTASSTINVAGTWPSAVYSLNSSAIANEYDLIPCYNLGMDSTEDSNFTLDKYQANSTILGGEGPNISYKFGAKLLRSDNNADRPSQPGGAHADAGTNKDVSYGSGSNPNKNGFRIPGNLAGPSITGMNPFSNNAPEQSYPSNNIVSSMAMEYFGGTYKSYQHNEIYRFAIVFYSKTGQSSFAKWIGDIKFPDYTDTPAPGLEGVTNAGTVCPDFRSLFLDPAGSYHETYSVVPYIDFSVNIPPALASLISGWEIVRVDRKREDMYIKAQGMVYESATQLIGSKAGTPNPADWPKGMLNESFVGMTSYTLHFDAYSHITDGFNGWALNFSSNDKIRYVERYSSINIAGGPNLIKNLNTDTSPAIPVEEWHYIHKYYNRTGTYNSTFKFDISNYVYLPIGGTDGIFQNWWRTTSGVIDYSALGSPTIGLYINSGTTTNTVNGTVGNYDKILALHYDPTRLQSQYNGRTYSKRSTNEYISTGAYYSMAGDSGVKNIKVFGGDIYHSILDVHKNIRNWGQSPLAPTTVKKSICVFFPSQSIYNSDLRVGSHVNRDLNINGSNADYNDDYYYNLAYSYGNTIKKYYPEPIPFNLTDTWVNRVLWSNVKINGETTDSWSSIPTLNYYDVEGAYGPINALVILNNKMYYIQERGFGYLYINPITTISGNNGLPVTLGKGDTVEKHEYLSIDAGTKHQWSVYRSNSAITFTDVRHKKIYLFNENGLVPISDLKGAKGFINKVLHDDILLNDNPIIQKGILVTYDHFNNEFLYTFRNTFQNTEEGDPILLPDEFTNESYTLVYSDLNSAFSSFYSFTPYIYINNRNKLYSLPDRNGVTTNLYLHNVGNYCEFYGTQYDSKLTSVINPNPLSTKIYDNISWVSESIKEDVKWKDNLNDFLGDSDDIPYLNNTITRFRCYNEYQNSDWLTLAQTNPITNLRKSEQGWNIQVPRNKVNYNSTAINTKSIFDPTILTKTTFGDRMRDKYLIVDLEYDNSLNNRFVLHNLKSTYRISDR